MRESRSEFAANQWLDQSALMAQHKPRYQKPRVSSEERAKAAFYLVICLGAFASIGGILAWGIK